ncbi:hypothetical protein EV360DRAFT_79403 [Lentinula raphanica]|nr:hypothetical protein EV360DRAFT_79403 [Lentinula raphanica]
MIVELKTSGTQQLPRLPPPFSAAQKIELNLSTSRYLAFMRFASTLFTLCVLGSFAITVTHAAPYVPKTNIVPFPRAERSLETREITVEDQKENSERKKATLARAQAVNFASTLAIIDRDQRRARARNGGRTQIGGRRTTPVLPGTPVQPATPANGNA